MTLVLPPKTCTIDRLVTFEEDIKKVLLGVKTAILIQYLLSALITRRMYLATHFKRRQLTLVVVASSLYFERIYEVVMNPYIPINATGYFIHQ